MVRYGNVNVNVNVNLLSFFCCGAAFLRFIWVVLSSRLFFFE